MVEDFVMKDIEHYPTQYIEKALDRIEEHHSGENWTSDITLQLDDAERLVKQFRYKSILLTRGSGYHSTDGQTNYEEELARRLGAIKYVGMFERAKQVRITIDDEF